MLCAGDIFTRHAKLLHWVVKTAWCGRVFQYSRDEKASYVELDFLAKFAATSTMFHNVVGCYIWLCRNIRSYFPECIDATLSIVVDIGVLRVIVSHWAFFVAFPVRGIAKVISQGEENAVICSVELKAHWHVAQIPRYVRVLIIVPLQYSVSRRLVTLTQGPRWSGTDRWVVRTRFMSSYIFLCPKLCNQCTLWQFSFGYAIFRSKETVSLRVLRSTLVPQRFHVLPCRCLWLRALRGS